MDPKCPLKWKGNEHGIVDISNARLLANGCSPGYTQVEEVDDSEFVASTAPTVSDRLAAATAWEFD